MNFLEKLKSAWNKNYSLVCIGLDPDLNKLPTHLKSESTPLFSFNKAIIDSTKALVCAYKPQFAYYAATGAERELEMTIDYIRQQAPEIPVILDAKRGDIGPTAVLYAREAFERYQADAVTVNPYAGSDTLTPFLDYQDKGIIVLCRTSNPGASTFQNLKVNEMFLYEYIAKMAVNEWNTHNNVQLVVGATYPQELRAIREIVGDMPLLVPGIGAQGGDIRAAVTHGKTSQGTGMIINSSRSIIYAGRGVDFANDSKMATETLRQEINQYR